MTRHEDEVTGSHAHHASPGKQPLVVRVPDNNFQREVLAKLELWKPRWTCCSAVTSQVG
jgi:hypothetical protein